MTDHREKFLEFLRQIFQFDCSDLDFGIYRIMNFKREAVEHFIDKDLPETIAKELSTGALASQSQVADELAETVDEIREKLGDTALNGEGVLAEQFHGTPLGKRYLDLQKRAFGTVARPALEARIFNHLYDFFRRYYDSGDFLSKRRYSRKEKYAIPYNGEEVYLHWANSDQYYVKTGEYFTDYRFKAPNGVTVHFRLQQADVPQNNVKGDKRFFIPLAQQAAVRSVPVETQNLASPPTVPTSELVIPFEYRPLNESEQTKYGQRNQQDAIITEAIETLPRHFSDDDVALAALIAKHHDASDGTEVSHLAHHLRQYTQKNTSDFFIHKDLKGFLTRELDFYLKNEVLNLDEMEAAGELRAEGWFQIMRVMKAIGGRIIDFLAQIEDFQKRLFEKKKFITETQYCITVGNIAEKFYADVAACEKQWAEWKELFHIDEEQTNLFTNGKSRKDKRIAFLKAHPVLVLDSRHFKPDFVDRLLGSFDDLDEMTDGLLIHSENFQALSLLLEKYREKIECIYIDPPYNSKTTEILYKNSYKHSSWLSLMDNRLVMSRRLASPDGSHIIAIDENEQEVLGRLLMMHFPEHERVCVAVVHNKKGIQGDYFSYTHDYAFFCIPLALPETHGKLIPEPEWEYTNLRKWGRESERETAKNCFYPIYVEVDQIVGFGDVCDESFHPEKGNVPCDGTDRRIAVYPIDSQGVERKWRYARNSVEGILHLLKVHVTNSDEVQILKAKAERQPKTVWDDPIYIAGDYGTKWLTDLGLKVKEDLYPKSIFTVMDSIYAVSAADALIADYFAGSGTTGHAVIKLNQKDGGRRHFILAEMGEYFDTVLLPRIKKVTFSPEWKDGKPTRQASEEEAERGPRIVKVLRLESYEDALNNIRFTDAPKTLYDFDDYVVRYMLEWEAKESATLLNIQQLASPFSYRLELGGEQETREKVADIPETFAYLLGMHVTTRRVYVCSVPVRASKETPDGVTTNRYLVYRGRIDHREIAVIWRDTAKWEKGDYERDKAFVAEQKLTEGADEIFVNGDSLIPNARSLDSLFENRMFAEIPI